MRIRFLLMLAATIPAAAVASPEPRINVTDVDFTVTETDDRGVTKSLSIPIITYRVGNCYTWSIRFAPTPGTAEIVEHFRLPDQAPNWGVMRGSPTKVGRRRSSAKTRITVDLRRGMASNGWCIAEGDPFGVYYFTIKQRGRTLHQFAFNVGEVL
jgi:hypothetical protein